MFSGESAEMLSNYTTQAKIKLVVVTTQLVRTTACQVLRIVRTISHSKASARLAYQSQRTLFTSQRA